MKRFAKKFPFNYFNKNKIMYTADFKHFTKKIKKTTIRLICVFLAVSPVNSTGFLCKNSTNTAKQYLGCYSFFSPKTTILIRFVGQLGQ